MCGHLGLFDTPNNSLLREGFEKSNENETITQISAVRENMFLNTYCIYTASALFNVILCVCVHLRS